MTNQSVVAVWKNTALKALPLLVLSATAFAKDPLLPVEAQVYAEAPMRVSTEGMTHEDYLQRQEELNQWLVTELPVAAFDTPIRVQLTQGDIDVLDRPSASQTPLAIGVVKTLVPRIEVGKGLAVQGPKQVRVGTRGKATPLRDGGLVWAQSVSAEGAGAVRVHIENMSLPEGVALYFYSLEGEAFGPYTGTGPNGTGEFWTESVFGTEGVLQLHFDANTGDKDITLDIADVGLITPRFVAPLIETLAFCGNLPCLVDASCHNGTPADPAKNATAKMEWIAGAFIYTCTGGLIADNNPNSSNFFLTANHCVSKNSNAQNVQFYWRFATSSCNGACPSNTGWPFKTTGSTVSKTGRRGDFTLLHLNANPPSGSVFLGWTSAPIAFTNGADLHRISNPNFGPQVYSMHDVDTGAGTCSGWPRGERIYSNDAVGGIDGGSSGSVVVNASSQIVGQLSGTCGFNPGDPCDSAANSTVDGAFAYYYSLVQPILNP